MSGGSFDYLCYKEFDQHDELLEQMAEELDRRGYALAARETRSHKGRIPAQKLRDLWQAIEWHVSCDWSWEDAQNAHEEFLDSLLKGE